MKITTLILSLFILFKSVIPLVEYAAFYDYIKNELCVNKNKPKLQCNGKCYLAKKLAEASESENNQDKKHISVEVSIVFFQEIKENFSFQPFFYKSALKAPLNNGNLSYSYLSISSIFRPPIV